MYSGPIRAWGTDPTQSVARSADNFHPGSIPGDLPIYAIRKIILDACNAACYTIHMKDKETKTETINIRLSADEKKKISELAARERRSITQLIIWLVEKYISR